MFSSFSINEDILVLSLSCCWSLVSLLVFLLNTRGIASFTLESSFNGICASLSAHTWFRWNFGSLGFLQALGCVTGTEEAY